MEQKYDSFIGLEVHIHLLTKTKVFCGCRSAFGDEPNTNVCPVCLGYPGVLPVLNLEAMRMGCTVARSLECTIPERTWFERKQYFYPDMTKNYQISQFASPLGQNGSMMLEGKGSDGKAISRKVRIKECHLEEDAGKMIHTGTVSLLDYNRAGVSLLEIVTEPDMKTGEEAELFIRQLRRLVRYLGVCDGNMEEGSLKADANVSINQKGKGLGSKVEIKNLNSSRFIRLGLNHEIGRQGILLDEGKPVVQETRLWNENRDQTETMRTKEDAADYRYFPEPDLPVFCPDKIFRESVENALVVLPQTRYGYFISDYGLNGEQAELIVDEKQGADYFENAVREAEKRGLEKKEAAARIANWMLTDIKGILNRGGRSFHDLDSFCLTPSRLAALIDLIAKGVISGKTAKKTAALILAEDKDPLTIVKEQDWEQVNDSAKIAAAAVDIAKAEEAVLNQIREARNAGNTKRAASLAAFLTGKVLAALGGRCDPKLAAAQVEALVE